MLSLWRIPHTNGYQHSIASCERRAVGLWPPVARTTRRHDSRGGHCSPGRSSYESSPVQTAHKRVEPFWRQIARRS